MYALFSFRSKYFPFTTTLKFCSAEPSGSQEYREAEDLLHIFSFENMQCSISEKDMFVSHMRKKMLEFVKVSFCD